MDGELAGLASSGAATLVGLMVSDAWAQARRRLAAFLGRGDAAGQAAAEAELSFAQAELVAAREAGDQEAAADVEASWRSRLRRELRSDPAAAAELRSLLAELAPPTESGEGGTVVNTISGRVYGTAVQGRDFTGLTFYGPGSPPGPGADADPDADVDVDDGPQTRA